MRLNSALLPLFAAGLLVASAHEARAEYVVLRSGTRLKVTGYEVVGERYRLHMNGGVAEIAAQEIAEIEPEEVFEPSPSPPAAKTPYQELIQSAAAHFGVDADLIHCVIAVESNFNPKAISRKNARGLMQLLPHTAARYGVHDIFDPKENIEAGTQYLRELLNRYKDNLALALAAYNAGPERVEHYGRRVPPYRETSSYVRAIATSYARVKAEAQKKTPGTGTMEVVPQSE